MTLSVFSFRSYVIGVVGGVCLTFGVMAGLVWSVDPYDVFGRNWAGIYFDSDVYFKRNGFKTYPHDGLLLGSSKVAYIDPDDVRGYRFFNGAMVGATPESMFQLLEQHPITLKHVVIGLDLFMFNEAHSPFSESGHGVEGPEGTLAYLFSFDFGKLAVKTVFKWAAGYAPSLLPNGQRSTHDLEKQDALFDAPNFAKALAHIRKSHYANYKFSDRRIHSLQQMKSWLDAHGISYTVYINPLSKSVLSMLRTMPAWAALGRLRTELAGLFPNMTDLSESDWSADQNFYHTDPFHFRAEVGGRFLSDLIENHKRRQR